MALPVLHTADEAAAYLGCSYRRVLQLIASGDLRARKSGRGYAISEDALAEYVRGGDSRPIPTGRPERATGRRVSGRGVAA